MTEREVQLLKHGKPVAYLRCNCCGHYSRGVSERGWCGSCEEEFRKMPRPKPDIASEKS